MRKTIYTLLVCSVLIISCSKAGEILDDSKQTNASSTRSGNTASDPYRLEAMQLAFDEISKASGIEHINLKPTDKYVKFIPDSVDCQKLSDMGITIYPSRLDGQDTIESVDGDDYIIEPVVSQDGKVWRYCVVPIDYQFSTGTEYELIYNVFIQRKGSESRAATQKQIDDEIYKSVLMSSLSMTGNLPSATWGTEWKPSAKLTFDLEYGENDIRQVPAVGLKVSVRSYTH